MSNDDPGSSDVAPPSAEVSTQEKTQAPGSIEAVVVSRAPSISGLPILPLTSTLKELQEAGIRGSAGMTLLQAFAGRVESEADDLRQERHSLRGEVISLRDRAEKAEKRVAVLDERLAGIYSSQPISVVLLTGAGTGIGIAFPYLTGAHSAIAILVIVVALAVAAAGWWLPRRRGGD